MNIPKNYYLFQILIILCCLILLIVNIFQGRLEVRYASSGQECRGQLKEDTIFVEENLSSLSQYDEKLISYVRARYLIPPPPRTKPYNLKTEPEETESSTWVRNYFRNKTNGIFIEAGANEGEHHSHTLTLEHDLGWTGLLIECNPTVVPYLRSKHRKAWVAGVCISTHEHPAVLNFTHPEKWTYSGRIGPTWNIGQNWTYFDVDAVPLYSIIVAAGFKEIDFFSFDVEGIEFDILRKFPFEKILIKLMIVEVHFIDQAKREELEEFMTSKGYTAVKKMDGDHIYAHNSELNKLN